MNGVVALPARPDPSPWAWPRPDLAIGGAPDRDELVERLRRHRIAAVVDLRREACDDGALLAALGVELLHLPTPDCCRVSARALCRGVAWVVQHQARGARVLIHCQHGIGRSAVLAACVLVRHGAAPDEALHALKQARPVVSPSRAQLRGLLAYAHRCARAGGIAPPATRLAALTAIAWAR